jgi:hypothetical protein
MLQGKEVQKLAARADVTSGDRTARGETSQSQGSVKVPELLKWLSNREHVGILHLSSTATGTRLISHTDIPVANQFFPSRNFVGCRNNLTRKKKNHVCNVDGQDVRALVFPDSCR